MDVNGATAAPVSSSEPVPVVRSGLPDFDGFERRVAELAGLANVVAAELVATVAEMIETGGWGGAGYRSPEHWVSLHCGVSTARAAQLCAMARRLRDLPVVAAAFRAGALSADQVAVIVRRTPPDRDAEVAELARYATVGQLRRLLASVPVAEEAEAHPADPADRHVSSYHDEAGGWQLRAELAADEGALVDKALSAARNDLFDAGQDAVSWADALVRMAHVALDGLDPATASGSTRPSARYQAIVHIDPASGLGQPHLAPAWLPASLCRYLTCDVAVRLALHDKSGRLLGISPSAPTVDPKLRAVIEQRDRGCRVPGCEQDRWLHVHHIRHREDGGLTVPSNLVCLCPHHHRQHHAGTLGVEGDPETPGGLHVTDRWGHPLGHSPPHPPPPTERSLTALATARGLPSGDRWKHPWGLPLDARTFSWN